MSSSSTQKLLLRRNTSNAADDDADSDAIADLLPPLSSLVDQAAAAPGWEASPGRRSRGNSAEATLLVPNPATSHKRKQSDALVPLLELDIGQAQDVVVARAPARSTLSPIEQGTSFDLDDENCSSGWVGMGGWKNRFIPFLSTCQLVGLFVTIVAITTLHSVSRSRNEAAPDGDNSFRGRYDDIAGKEEVGDPMEARAPEGEWVEFYNSVGRMPQTTSSGPWPVNDGMGGLHMFENVCVTNNVDAPKPPDPDTSQRGLLYFSREVKTPKHCVPCSRAQMESKKEDGWDAPSDGDSELGHLCGMRGLHAMFAPSVTGYNECMADAENHKMMIRTKQNQSPSRVERVHFFRDPTFLLQFDANDRERSLFDMLLTFLPHWHKFAKSGGDFPFDSVISHSVEGCLTHSKNWLCEVLHQGGALGRAKELPWEHKETTLYCFKNIYYNQMEYQRELRHEGLLTKSVMDDFRDEVFWNMALPGPRDQRAIKEKDAKLGLKRKINILLCANGREEWKDLDKLVVAARSSKKYHNVEFNLVDGFDSVAVAKQAYAFNMADAVISSSGEHLANVIFTPDDSYFVEVGCSVKSLIGNPHFMALLSGTHRRVERCPEDALDKICVSCLGGGKFIMSEEGFHTLIDDIVKKHEDDASFAAPS